MLTTRIIPCLDVTAGRVVKGINFVELRDAGDPVDCAVAYAGAGADEVVCVGDGVDRYRRELGAAPGVECLPAQYSAPSPLALCELADVALTAGDGGPPEDLVPVYLRESDAVINWEQARGSAP